MSAPVLNPSSIAPPGFAAGKPGVAAPAATGFEALMAALFPQAGPGASSQSPGPPTPVVTPPVAPEGVEATSGKVLDESESVVTEPAASDAAAEAASALLTGIAASVQAPAAQPSNEARPAEPASAPDAATPNAWGCDKAGSVHADPRARLAEKGADGPEAARGQPPHEAAPQPSGHAKADPRPHAQANGMRVPASTPVEVQGSPVQAPVAPADAEVAQPAGSQAAPSAGSADSPVVAPTMSSLTAKGGPEAATPPQAGPKAERPRSDRGKSTEALAAAQPGAPRSAHAAAKPAAEGKPTEVGPDAFAQADPAPTQETAAPDYPDFAAASEAPDATQSGAPASAHATSHPVRGAPETVASLAAQIVKKLEGRSTRFDVELDPAGLGKVDVRVEIGPHGRMTAAMVCDNPQAAQELRARAGELHRALEQAGFDLSGGLSFDVAGDRGHARQDWQAPDDSGQGFRGPAFRAALDTAGEAAEAAVSGALRLRRGVNAGLDLRI